MSEATPKNTPASSPETPTSTPAPPDAAAAEALARDLTLKISQGDIDGVVAHFDDTMKQGLSAEKLKATWKGLDEGTGGFQEIVKVRSEVAGAYQRVYVTCRFGITRLDLKYAIDSSLKVAGFFISPSPPEVEYQYPDYVQQDAFTEEEVIVGEKGEYPLPGTLSLPKGDDPVPAVILVHGSGPNDRDESIGAVKPFKDLAGGLASRGIAVLRYDKRTKVHGAKMMASPDAKKLTYQEKVIDDVLAAAELLRQNERIDKKRIFVLGHSLGGMMIPRIGAQDPNLTGFIVMAGGGSRPLEDIVLDQVTYISSLDGTISEAAKTSLDALKKQVEKVKDPALSLDTPAEELPLNIPASFWLDLRGYSPPEAAKALLKPLLVLQGEKDYQVTKEDFESWKAALSGRKDVTLTLYPNLNHAFMEVEGKSSPADYEKPDHISGKVIEDIASWIKNQKPLP